MSLLLHICTALGLALAAGIRPFTPALAAGALASADALFDFTGTDYAFLQSPWFLLVVACSFGVSAILRGRVTRELVATAGVALVPDTGSTLAGAGLTPVTSSGTSETPASATPSSPNALLPQHFSPPVVVTTHV